MAIEQPEAPATCGMGLAQHAEVPARLAVMFEGLAETLELHRQMLVLADENSRREDAVYEDLARRWRSIAEQVAAAAALMEAQRDLPMGAHDESAWGEGHVQAYAKFVQAQGQVRALLDAAVARDEAMLAAVRSG